jgi:uncharacterized damage-inducible protein DinB
VVFFYTGLCSLNNLTLGGMMMFNKVDDFVTEWAQETRMTEAVMKALTDESLTQAVANERRTLGQLAWHLVRSIHFMSHV